MYCLRCGECCRTMSPLERERADGLANDSCRALSFRGDVSICGIYFNRPKQCADHEYASYKFCPIGMQILNVNREEAAARVQLIDFREAYLE